MVHAFIAPVLFALAASPEAPVPEITIRPDDGPRVELVLRPPDRVAIPAGRFRMGATRAQVSQSEALCARDLRAAGALDVQVTPACRLRADLEGPAAEVFVPAFSIDRVEVSVASYRACVEAGACKAPPDWVARLSQGRDDHPVEAVTFWEAVRFCRARGGRLPTEAEWERAARGLGERLFPWGRHYREGLSNHGLPVSLRGQLDEGPGAGARDDRDGFADSAPGGSFPAGASPYGVADLAGNVWEWTSGVFSHRPPQATETLAPDGVLFGAERTVRGGGYLSPRSALRVTGRWGLPPGSRLRAVGFRCVYDRVPPAN